MPRSEPAQAQPTQPRVFAKESTGMLKNASHCGIIALNLSNMSFGALLGVVGLYGRQNRLLS